MSFASLDDAVRSVAGLALARVERMSGTGTSATVRVTGILKFGPDRSEADLLLEFRQALGEEGYAELFPSFRELGRVDDRFVTEYEYLGDTTLEQLLLGDGALDADRVFAVFTSVVGVIERLAGRRPDARLSDACRSTFLAELLEALRTNAATAGVPMPELTIDRLEERARFVPTLCHRDLTAPNVMCVPGGGIRLIDPRWSLPGSKRYPSRYGTVAADVAAFTVSIERKELERVRMGLSQLDMRLPTDGIAQSFLAAGLFDQFTLDLCVAHAYSVYAACRCDYCLAPEREWLYDLMRKRFEEVSTRIA